MKLIQLYGSELQQEFNEENFFKISLDTTIENITEEEGFIGVFMYYDDYKKEGWNKEKSFYVFEKILREKTEIVQSSTFFVDKSGKVIELDYKKVWHTQPATIEGYERKFLGQLMQKETFDKSGWNFINTFTIYVFTPISNEPRIIDIKEIDMLSEIIEKHNLNFNTGNVVHHVLMKNDKLENLKKAKIFLEKEISFLEKKIT